MYRCLLCCHSRRMQVAQHRRHRKQKPPYHSSLLPFPQSPLPSSTTPQHPSDILLLLQRFPPAAADNFVISDSHSIPLPLPPNQAFPPLLPPSVPEDHLATTSRRQDPSTAGGVSASIRSRRRKRVSLCQQLRRIPFDQPRTRRYAQSCIAGRWSWTE